MYKLLRSLTVYAIAQTYAWRRNQIHRLYYSVAVSWLFASAKYYRRRHAGSYL